MRSSVIWKIVAGLFAVAVVLGLFVFQPWNGGGDAEVVNRQESAATKQNLLENSQGQEELQSPGDTQDVEAETREVTLAFAGDVLFDYGFPGRYDAGGIDAVISPELRAVLTDADITMVNHEFCFSTGGVKQDKQYTFRVDPKYVGAFHELGVDIVTLANNHALDYGREALSDTFATLDDAGIMYAGAGETRERARALQTIQSGGRTFGFLAASRVIPESSWNVDNAQPGMFCTYDDTQLCAAITAAKQECDYVTVYVHWGIERDSMPQDYQVTMARHYIDAGADLVIGSHTHCLQGIEFYNGKPILYGMGNFIFNTTINSTMAAQVTVDENNESTVRVFPAYARDGCTQLMDEASTADLYRYLESISFGITIDDQGIVSPATT